MPSRVRLVQRHSHNVLLVHAVWATAGRSSTFEPSADAWLAEVLRGKAYEVGCELIVCGNADDHVHVLVRYPSTVRLADVVHRMKGGSSYDWNASRRSPRLSWQPGYWAESFSPADLTMVMRYVEQQRAHHGGDDLPERWQSVLSPDSGAPRRSEVFSSATKTVGPVRA